ncbi:MAG: DUF11 domain-containing protein, partial [Actinomycetota bacterium]|nr:DUF11 domain-containing protein [Actinomycetota bacterium]
MGQHSRYVFGQGAKRALACVVGLVAGLLMITATPGIAPPAAASVRTPFTASFNTQDNGAIAMTGNSQMSCPTSTACTAARSGTASATNNNNNAWNMRFLDQDTSNTTSNSTSAGLTVPAGSTVLYAVLTWGGRQIGGSGGVKAAGRINQVQFQVPGGSYTTLTAGKVIDPGLNTGTDSSPYFASADVTNAVKTAGNGTYWVGNIAAATGQDRYAGWSLTVVYRNPAFPLRDLRVYEGFADVTSAAGNNSVDIPISGILTPATGTVNAAIGFVAWEGDLGITGDGAALVNNGTVTPLSNASRPADNFFDSAIAEAGANITDRNPNYVNNLGVDIGQPNANGAIPNNATSTTVRVTTNGDFYYPTQITSQIDLFTPAFNPISKTVTNLSGHDPAQPGDTLEYQLNFTNTGADFADNAVIRDPLPANTTYVPGSLSVLAGAGQGAKTDAAGDDTAEYVAASRLVRFRVGTGASATAGGTLAPNASVTARFRVTVDRAAVGSALNNGALLDYRARTIGKDYTFTGNVVSTPVQQLADLAISKTSDPTTQTAGGTLVYRLQVTNNGPNAATNVVVTDTLPTGVNYVSAAPPTGTTCTATGNKITCTTSSLANGATLAIPITVSVPPGSASGTLANTATVASDTADDVAGNNTATATTIITQLSDVSLTKSGAPATVIAGNQVTYTLTASNVGPSTAAAVQVTDVLPAGVTLVSATSTAGSCAQSGSNEVCQLGPLAPGEQQAITIVVKTAANLAAGSLTNTATASTTTPESSGANNSATATTTVATSADVSVTKTAPATATAGTAVNFTIRVNNSGPSDAQGVTVSDPLPAGYTATSASSTQGTCTIGATVRCTIGTVAQGSTITVTVLGIVDSTLPPGDLTNTANVNSTTADPNATNNSDNATVHIVGSADLALSKSSSPATITYGQPVSYQLTVTNNGPSTSSGVITSDLLPAGFTFASSADGCVATANNTVTCSIGTVPVGTTATRSFVVNTPSSGPTPITNTARVSADTPDPTPGNNTASAVSNGQAQADLSLTKATLTDNPRSGGAIAYQLVVTNNGPSDAPASVIVDTLPTGISYASAAGATCSAAGQTVTCAVGTIPNGQQRTITLNGTIGNNTRGSSTNTATVSSAAADPSPGNNTAGSTVTIQAIADLAVTLTPRSPTVIAGEKVTYDLVVTNNGPATADATVITGSVPPGMTPVPGSSGGACTVSGGTVTCPVGNLVNGQVIRIQLVATVNASTPAGDLTGSATVGSTTTDPIPANNSATATVTVVTRADLAVSKSVTPDSLVAGSTASYSVVVTNNGPSDAVGATVKDTIPTGLTPTGSSATIGSCSVAGQQITCTAATLAAGQTMTVRIPVAVAANATGPITNAASATSDTQDPIPANNAASITSPVGSSADLRLTKTADQSTATAGSALTYTLTLTNTGPSDAAATTLSDTLRGGMTVLPDGVSAPNGNCTVSTDRVTVSCSFGTLPAGQSRVVVIDALVPQDTPTGSTLVNVATADSPTPDPSQDDRTAEVDTSVDTSADIVVAKAPVNTSPDAGTQQSYVISVSNNGTSLARGVVFTDPLPAGTTFVSAISSIGVCSSADGSIRCDIGDLPAGRSATVQTTVQLASNIAGSNLTNVAHASSMPATGDPTPDPDTTNNSSTVTQVVAARSNLQLKKAVTSGPVVAGDRVTYQVTLTNNGPSDAANPFIADPIASDVSFVSADAGTDGSCAASGTPPDPVTVNCTWPSVPNGGQRVATITVLVPADTTDSSISNSVTGGSDSFDPTPPTATTTDAVTEDADLTIHKDLLSGQPIAGGTVRWQITVHNNGPSTARAVAVQDKIPTAVTLGAVPVSAQGTCTSTGTPQTVDCALGDLAPNADAIVVVTGTLAADFAGAELDNTATTSSPTPDSTPGNNEVTIHSPTTTQADLNITKTGAPATLTAGQPVTWTLTVSNPSGPSDADTVTITDPLPAGVSDLTAAVPGGNCTISGSLLTCTVPTIGIGSSAVVTVHGTVQSNYTGDSLANAARVSAKTPDPNQADNSASAQNPVTTAADLSVTKTGPPQAAKGDSIQWTVTVHNAGASDATNVQLTDQLPAGLLGTSVTGPAGPCPVTAGAATCNLGTMIVGTDATITVSATIDPASPATALTNRATVNSSTRDNNQANNSASFTTQLSTAADLTIHKQLTGTAVAGQPISWVITIDNIGPSAASNVVISDAVPHGVTDVTASLPGAAPCTVVGGSIQCTLDSLAPGNPDQITVSGTLAADYGSDQIANTATISSATTDPDSTNNSSTATSPVGHSADVNIGKAITSGPPIAGAPVTFELDVSNSGPSDASGVLVNDSLPATVLNASTDNPDCTVTNGVVACDLGTVANGQTVKITVTGTLSQDLGDHFANTATVSADTTDPNAGNNSSTAAYAVGDSADLSITKTGPATVTAGSTATWSVVVTNSGPSNARDVVLDEQTPVGVSDLAVTLPDGTSCADPQRCVLGTLAPSDSVTVTVTGTVDSGYQGPTVVNSASVASATGDPDGRNNSAQSTSTVDRSATFTVTKTSHPATLVPGEPAIYTITVHNTGPSDAPASSLTDALPDGITVRAPGVTSSQGSCTPIGRRLDCSLGTITSGADATITVPVSIDPAFPRPTIVNSATASNRYGPDATGTVTSDVTPKADLTVRKTGPATVTAGSPITWTIDVDNAGPSTARDVVLVDTLPAGVHGVDVTASQGSCAVDIGVVRCVIGALAGGDQASVQVTIAHNLDPSFTGSLLVNTAEATSPTPEPQVPDPADPTKGGRVSSVTTTVTTKADVQVFKSTDTPTAAPGDRVSWRIVARNNGPSTARNVVVTDSLPTGLSDVTFSPPAGVGCTAVGRCTVGDLMPGQANEKVITVVGTINQNDTDDRITNSASATSDTADPNPGNNSVDSPILLSPTADLRLEKTGPATAVPGGRISWRLTVTNLGISTARDVSIVDRLPAGISHVAVTGPLPTGVTCATPSTDITCSAAIIDPGARHAVTVTITATIDPGTTAALTNSATATSPTADPIPDNNTDSVTTTIQPQADLRISKSGPKTITAGAPIAWTVTLTNAGPSTARSVKMTDAAPKGVTGFTFDPPAGVSCTVASCAVGDLAPNQTVTIRVTGTVAAAPAGTVLQNVASVTSDTADPKPDNNSAAWATSIGSPPPSADLAISKSATSAAPVAGGTVGWQLVVVNNGPAAAADVVVTDPLPAGFQLAGDPPVGCMVVAGTVRCNLGELSDGQRKTIRLQTSIDSSVIGRVTNAARVSSATPDPDLASNVASAAVTVSPPPTTTPPTTTPPATTPPATTPPTT